MPELCCGRPRKIRECRVRWKNISSPEMKALTIAFLAVLAMVVCAQDKQAAAPPIFSDSIIQSWACRTLKSESSEQSGREARHFGKATIRLWPAPVTRGGFPPTCVTEFTWKLQSDFVIEAIVPP